MKRYLVGGLVTALAAGGLGFTTGGVATASPVQGSGAQGTAICSVLPVLCPPVTGAPTTGLQTALAALLAGGSTPSPALVQDVVTQLGGSSDLPTATLTATVTGVLSQLQAGSTGWPAGTLDPAMLGSTIGQVLAQLPAGATPTQVRGLVTSVVDLVTGLVQTLTTALTGTGAPSAAISDLATGLLAGDPAAITAALTTLSGSLDPAQLQSLVGTLVSALGDLGGTGSPFDAADLQALLGTLVDAVGDAAGGTLDPAKVQGLLTGLVDALTGANASDPFGSLTQIARELITTLQGLGTSTVTNLTVLVNRLLPVAGLPTVPTTPTTPTRPGAPASAALATPSLAVAKYDTTKRPRFSGRGTAGATVTVRTTAGRVLATVRVPSGGSWAVKSKPKLKRAAYKVVARQSASGRTGSAASATRTVRVVSAKPVQTTTRSTKANRPTFTGVGYPGARITVRTKAGRALATTKVKSNGTYKVRSRKTLRNGSYKIRVTQKRGSKTLKSTFRTVRVR
ncbi:Ig-like domain-containing protein [Solicola sp. PLA-1-18]|uniref:Ig-like domain-containing protein n=1 Tax=Solicola sp. PLA-1-18 TaxID=3380532 RepID=UPI003B7E2F39